MKACEVLISGRVQGVGFRWFTEQEARARNVQGYVRNRADGCVEVFAQADEPSLAEFCERLQEGPPAARVEDVETMPASVDPALTSFTVRY